MRTLSWTWGDTRRNLRGFPIVGANANDRSLQHVDMTPSVGASGFSGGAPNLVAPLRSIEDERRGKRGGSVAGNRSDALAARFLGAVNFGLLSTLGTCVGCLECSRPIRRPICWPGSLPTARNRESRSSERLPLAFSWVWRLPSRQRSYPLAAGFRPAFLPNSRTRRPGLSYASSFLLGPPVTFGLCLLQTMGRMRLWAMLTCCRVCFRSPASALLLRSNTP